MFPFPLIIKQASKISSKTDQLYVLEVIRQAYMPDQMPW